MAEMDISLYETTEFEVPWKDGKKATVKIRELSAGEKTSLNERYTDVKLTGDTGNVSVQPFELKLEAAIKSVIEAPWTPNKPEVFKNLPDRIASIVIDKVDEFCNVLVIKNASGVEHSEEEEQKAEQPDTKTG